VVQWRIQDFRKGGGYRAKIATASHERSLQDVTVIALYYTLFGSVGQLFALVLLEEVEAPGCIYTIRTTCWVMHNACACGSPVIGWSTHVRACT